MPETIMCLYYVGIRKYMILNNSGSFCYSHADYINEKKLAQDHSCVLNLIRHMYMVSPSQLDVPYNFTELTPGFVTGERDGSDLEALLLKNRVRMFT